MIKLPKNGTPGSSGRFLIFGISVLLPYLIPVRHSTTTIARIIYGSMVICRRSNGQYEVKYRRYSVNKNSSRIGRD